MNTSYRTDKCPACNGDGFIMEYDDSPGYLIQTHCTKCNGTGIFTPTVQIQLRGEVTLGLADKPRKISKRNT
jgi:DnaJ-class molecular chaperone